MNKIFLLFLFAINFIFSQQEDEVKCGWYGKKTVAERNQMFPFNSAKRVVYISYYENENYSDYYDDNGKIVSNDSLLNIHLTKIATKIFYLKNGGKYFAKEIVELNTEQINNLSNLVFNFKIKLK
jgi:hypothetical protein